MSVLISSSAQPWKLREKAQEKMELMVIGIFGSIFSLPTSLGTSWADGVISICVYNSLSWRIFHEWLLESVYISTSLHGKDSCPFLTGRRAKRTPQSV